MTEDQQENVLIAICGAVAIALAALAGWIIS